MKRILMTALSVLVVATPLTLAGTSASIAAVRDRHCTYQGEIYDLCHTDRHKEHHNSGVSHSNHRR